MKFGISMMKSGSGDGGLDTYETQLVRNLARIDADNEYHVLGYLPSMTECLGINQANFHMHAVAPHNKWVGMTTTLPLAMKRLSLPMVHGPFAIPLWTPCPFVFTVHDYYMFAYPEFLPTLLRIRLQGMYRRAIRRASRLICISGFVRDMVVENFDVPEDRISVVYNGCSPQMQPGDIDESRRLLKEKYSIGAPFFLYIGRMEPRKNVTGMLEAFARFHHDVDPAVKFVLVGEKTWSREEVDGIIRQRGLADAVIEVGYVPEDDVPHFYRASHALLFATMAEGFGLPIIEAMACGAPVITSTTTCMPEVAGGAALLADPRNTNDITAQMEKVHNDDALRRDLVARGLMRARDFSWRKTAEGVLDVYKTI